MAWSLVQVNKPDDPVVRTADAKLHLRVEHDAEDTLIDRIVQAATERAEVEQARAFVTQTFRLTLPRFPSARCIRLPRPPLQRVESVTYLDRSGDEQTLSSDAYRVDTDSEPGRVILKSDERWPRTACEPDAVRITYVAGYGEGGDIPEATRSAILLLAGHLYENRETVTVGTGPTFRLPMGPEYLLYPHRVSPFDPLGGG